MRWVVPLSLILTFLVTISHASCAEVRATWNASDRATGYKLYAGTASGVYPEVTDVGNLTTVSLGGFTEGQLYYFAVTAYNPAGESGYSTEVAYTVPEAAVIDSQPPTVQWKAPTPGSRVPRKGLVTLEATATDTGGLAHVAFSVNGQVMCTMITPPYRCAWRVPGAANRRYALQAVATDGSGNVGMSAPVTVEAK